jgi:DNA polymerase-3 subunit delta
VLWQDARETQKVCAPMKTKAARQPAYLYAVVGSDESAVKAAAAELAVQLAPADAGDFWLEVIDGCADNAKQAAARIRSAIEALQTLPFFGGGKLVWLKNANFLGDSKLGGAAAVQDALEELRSAIEGDLGGGEVKFLLSAPEVDKRRSFYKALAKRAELQVFDKLDASRSGWEEEALDLARSLGREHQLRFEEEALDLFVLLTGGDRRTIQNELEKLDLFLGPKERRVTLETVRTLVPISRGGVIFELGNALAARDLERALALVRRLLDQGESAIGILLVAIIPTVRNLLLAKDLMERHRLPRPAAPFSFISTLNRLPAEAIAHLPRKKDGSLNAYPLGIAALHARHFETRRLIAGLEACLQANLQIVSTQLDHELILNQVVVKLLV